MPCSSYELCCCQSFFSSDPTSLRSKYWRHDSTEPLAVLHWPPVIHHSQLCLPSTNHYCLFHYNMSGASSYCPFKLQISQASINHPLWRYYSCSSPPFLLYQPNDPLSVSVGRAIQLICKLKWLPITCTCMHGPVLYHSQKYICTYNITVIIQYSVY